MRCSRFRDRQVRRHWGKLAPSPVIADALDAAAVKAAVARIRPDAVINELTSLPRRYTPDEMKATSGRHRKVRVEGNINLLAALRDAGVRRYLLQSSGFWYEAWRGACGRGSLVHLQRISGSRGRRSHLFGIGSARVGDAGNRVRRAPLRILLWPRHLVHARRRYWRSGCGNGKFRLSGRVRGSPASCISTMRPERPPPRWSVRPARTTSLMEAHRLSACGCRRSRALRGRLRRLASAKKTRFGRWAPMPSITRQGLGAPQTRRPDASLGSVRARSSGFRRHSRSALTRPNARRSFMAARRSAGCPHKASAFPRARSPAARTSAGGGRRWSHSCRASPLNPWRSCGGA